MRISDWSSDVCSSDLLDHDEEQTVLLRQSSCGADHQVGARRVGEFGEQYDQRAAVELCAEGGEREGEIAFDMRIVDQARGALQRREILRVHIGGGQRLRLGGEGEETEPVDRKSTRLNSSN